ncbi:hypothetical protein NM688_g3924 [Phlebia brevispora]|uniref:Uncharacterized protein n=1 Tax=Phlebia brevispora TaxID=194682 RepID=A0ACC1T4Q6_9APHY|nr:hypothetical protein NM688_g3924 [Phlebia brevispora]
MLNELERLYAARFAHGDQKAAKNRLRGQTQDKTHHFSTFRTGMLLGLALPAFIDGIYLSFLPHTRDELPGYDGLLFVYGILFTPVLFSILVGINILVWSRTRINYVFIFELDVKTKLDHREYFEIPALLLSTLCYAFWLSFSRIGLPHFNPVLWPLIWILFAAVIMFDPLPVLFKTSRWWLIRNTSRLLTSGMHRVEFADFWMGDQFCSLVFSLSNIYFLVCSYTHSFDKEWQRCNTNSGRAWGVPFVLAIIPFVVRLVQSVKRCGKGREFRGLVHLWNDLCFDLLMDWSVLRPHAHHPFLRNELLYTGFIPLYYFAIVTNVLIRFIWVFYIPEHGPSIMLRTWIAAMLEMLRRVQWNFIRLENEHVGNMDQYRVTREVPLPYSFDDAGHDSDGDEDDERKSISSWKKRKAKQPMRSVQNEGESTARDELNVAQSRD